MKNIPWLSIVLVLGLFGYRRGALACRIGKLPHSPLHGQRFKCLFIYLFSYNKVEEMGNSFFENVFHLTAPKFCRVTKLSAVKSLRSPSAAPPTPTLTPTKETISSLQYYSCSIITFQTRQQKKMLRFEYSTTTTEQQLMKSIPCWKEQSQNTEVLPNQPSKNPSRQQMNNRSTRPRSTSTKQFHVNGWRLQNKKSGGFYQKSGAQTFPNASSPQFRVACLMAGKSARRELKFICRHKEATQGESKKEKLVTSGVCYASMLQRETDPINSKPTQKNSRGKKRQLRSTLIATVILKANEKLSGEEREGLLSSPPPLLYSDPSTSPLESFFDSLQFCVSFNVQDGGENIYSIIVHTCKIFQLCTLERRQQTLCEQAPQ